MLCFVRLLYSQVHCVTTERLFDTKQCVQDRYHEQLKNDVKESMFCQRSVWIHGSRELSGYCIILRIGHAEGNNAKWVKSYLLCHLKLWVPSGQPGHSNKDTWNYLSSASHFTGAVKSVLSTTAWFMFKSGVKRWGITICLFLRHNRRHTFFLW